MNCIYIGNIFANVFMKIVYASYILCLFLTGFELLFQVMIFTKHAEVPPSLCSLTVGRAYMLKVCTSSYSCCYYSCALLFIV